MNEIVPRVPVLVRPATMDDLPFVDRLQKKHSNQVGWMPTKALVGKIEAGQVLVADATNADCRLLNVDGGENAHLQQSTINHQQSPVGYVIGQDQYFKRDDVGIIYQMNVTPSHQRGLVGVTLIKALFGRAAYGCRLFCCWCAQDIEANYFWESLGFIPLAFRAGSREKGRVHIFWQRRIREGDATTPYWFPSQTTSGSIREDRLVLPIPPGTHWRDVMPVVLPGDVARATRPCLPDETKKQLTGGSPVPQPVPQKPTRRRVQFGPPPVNPQEVPEQATFAKPKKAKKQPVKNDPAHVAAARELRDRWLERVNANPQAIASGGKYDLTKALAAPTAPVVASVPALPAPIAA